MPIRLNTSGQRCLLPKNTARSIRAKSNIQSVDLGPIQMSISWKCQYYMCHRHKLTEVMAILNKSKLVLYQSDNPQPILPQYRPMQVAKRVLIQGTRTLCCTHHWSQRRTISNTFQFLPNTDPIPSLKQIFTFDHLALIGYTLAHFMPTYHNTNRHMCLYHQVKSTQLKTLV